MGAADAAAVRRPVTPYEASNSLKFSLRLFGRTHRRSRVCQDGDDGPAAAEEEEEEHAVPKVPAPTGWKVAGLVLAIKDYEALDSYGGVKPKGFKVHSAANNGHAFAAKLKGMDGASVIELTNGDTKLTNDRSVNAPSSRPGGV